MKALRTIRKAKGLTVKHCASIVGVSDQAWTRYEGLKTEPSWEVAEAIAQLLGVSLDQLAGRSPFGPAEPATDRAAV